MAAAEDERRGEMIYRTLGRTGEKVSAIGLGGSHIGQMKDGQMKDGQMKDGQMRDGQDAIRLVRKAIDRGLTFMDNSWDYHNGNGQGEIKMWKALRDGCRQKTFPMTKVDGRTKDSAAREIDESLKRLQTDHVPQQCHGRALPQLWAGGAARGSEEEPRHPVYEASWQRHHYEERHGIGDGPPALRPDSARLGVY
jgi:hypothetical protein